MTADELQVWLASYDWKHALDEALYGGYQYRYGEPGEKPLASDALGIVDVVAESAGENDESSWLAILRLGDGRYAYLSAWCDYTGWDCQAGGSLSYAHTLAELCRMELDEAARQRLGFDVFGERVAAQT